MADAAVCVIRVVQSCASWSKEAQNCGSEFQGPRRTSGSQGERQVDLSLGRRSSGHYCLQDVDMLKVVRAADAKADWVRSIH